MRNRFIYELIQQAKLNSNIIFIVGDLGYKVIEPFVELLPSQFINAGVAEQNMIGIASGLASENYKVFVYSIANFPTFRCAEQIRNDVDYHNSNVVIVAVGGGYAYGSAGYSHHAVQDFGLMRLFPNMLIVAPGDQNEVSGCMRYLEMNEGPHYLRLNKAGENNYTKHTVELEPGKLMSVIKSNKRKAFITTGAALQFHYENYSNNFIQEYDLYTLPIWGIKSQTKICKELENFEEVIIAEDHIRSCGLFSYISELKLMNNALRKMNVRSYAIDENKLQFVGDQDYLNRRAGLYDLKPHDETE